MRCLRHGLALLAGVGKPSGKEPAGCGMHSRRKGYGESSCSRGAGDITNVVLDGGFDIERHDLQSGVVNGGDKMCQLAE